jgi:hypothetical protein
MTTDLYALVYYSRNRVAKEPAALADEIQSILAASRRNNERAGVTGALMFNAGCFGQVLEGSLTAVEAVFERIQQDPRHGDVSLLGISRQDGRSFENWSMGFVGASIDDAARFGSIGLESGYDPSRLDGVELFRALKSMALEEEAA